MVKENFTLTSTSNPASAVFVAHLRSGHEPLPKIKALFAHWVWKSRRQWDAQISMSSRKVHSIVVHPYLDTSSKYHYKRSYNISIGVQWNSMSFNLCP